MEDRQALDDIIYLHKHLKHKETIAFHLSSTGEFGVDYNGASHRGTSATAARNWLVHKLLEELE